MTIRKGEEWGVAIERPDGLLVLADDAALAAHDGDRPVAPGGGDLHRTLGEPTVDRPVVQRVEVDGLRVVLDGEVEHRAIAHVVLRRSWWRGPVVAVMNVSHTGTWNVAPRAHPNDGRFDTVEVAPEMPLRARWAAWRRMPAGAHVPHPQIATGRHTAHEWTFAQPVRVWVDGVRVGTAQHVGIELVPDRYTVHF